MKDLHTIKWGIIGLGRIAHQFAQELQLVKGAELVAVASRSKDNAVAFAASYHCQKAYDSYEDIMNDTTIDILYIATPHDSHAELTLKALKKKQTCIVRKADCFRL